MSENRIGQEEIQAGMESIKAEMAAWAGVQNTILEVLEGHTDLLGKINRAVQRQDSGESDPLGELLRQIAANGLAHTEGRIPIGWTVDSYVNRRDAAGCDSSSPSGKGDGDDGSDHTAGALGVGPARGGGRDAGREGGATDVGSCPGAGGLVA